MISVSPYNLFSIKLAGDITATNLVVYKWDEQSDGIIGSSGKETVHQYPQISSLWNLNRDIYQYLCN